MLKKFFSLLPDGNFARTFFYLIAILILLILIFRNFDYSQVKISNQLWNKEQDINLDSDDDGLKDWQEKIYHTDKDVQDTDKDGVYDFVEVSKGWDPTVFGHGDQEVLNATFGDGSTKYNLDLLRLKGGLDSPQKSQ